MKKLLLLLFGFALLTNAQTFFYPTYNLSNTPSATSDYHSVYSEMNDYYVVWGDNGQIMFKYSSNYGETWEPNVILTNTSNTCGWPVVTADGQNVYVLYHQLAGNYEIIFQRSTDWGQSWSQMQGLSGMDSGSITPQIAVGSNKIYAVWEQKINNIADIYFTKSTDSGINWSTVQNISNSPAANSRWVQLYAIGNTLFCAWIEMTTYPLSDIYFSKSTNGGTSWTTPVNLTNDARPQNRIYMDADYYDNVFIASDDIITFNHDEIYLLKSTDGGSSWSQPRNITNNDGNSNTPCIVVMGNQIYFTWSDNSHTAPAYNNSDIFFKWSSDGGITWHDSTNISDNPETSSRPRMCAGYNGPLGAPWYDFTIVWYDYSTGDSEILARRGMHLSVPVELVAFNADIEKNVVVLNWSTATETNNKGFQVERKPSMDNGQWSIAGFVNGVGTTTELNYYSFKDDNLFSGKYFYRLKQIDFDGSFEYSNEIEIEVGLPDEFVLYQNYPNPFNPATMIKYAIPNEVNSQRSMVNLKVYDVLGNEIATLVNEQQKPGVYEVEFYGSNLASGLYFFSIKAGSYNAAKKMMMLK
ncbi:MAG: exo-alpha-sialidase [Ignavibacteriaceae bacterium]|nr:exo-alpha-sialidase [Ignavibacteriaceae bacterium]